jgi:hypothetical protein
MLSILNRPVNAETDDAGKRQLRDQGASRLTGQLSHIKPWVVQEASQAPAGSFKVIEAARQGRLTATFGRQQCHDEVADGVALMAVCIVKDQVDILDKASGSRVLSFHNPILYRVNHSFHSPHSKCVQTSDFRNKIRSAFENCRSYAVETRFVENKGLTANNTACKLLILGSTA